MNLRNALTSILFVCLSHFGAWADTIIQYDTQGIGSGSPTAAQVNAVNPAAGVTGIAATRGAGLAPTAASFSLNATGWNDLAADDFIQFGFTTTQPYLVEQLTVGLRSSGSGPGFVNLLYSKDGGAFTELASTNPITLNGTQFNNLSADLTEIGLVNDSLIFRLVVDPDNTLSAGGGTIGSSGTFRFASYSPSSGVFLNPEITGQAAAAAVPEPSTFFLLGATLTIVGGAFQRRRR